MSNMVDPLVDRIGTRVRRERDRRGWSLADLAEASGVSRAMIHRIERGESNPTAVVLGKLSAAFRISIATLLSEAEAEAEAEAGAEGRGGAGGVPDAASPGRGGAAVPVGTGGPVGAPGLGPRPGVRRAPDLPEWTDPATGYRRRQISAPGFPAEVAEILLPAGAEVPYPAAAFAFHRQIVWVLEGPLVFHEGETVHHLDSGDTLELGAPAPCAFVNPGERECRYAVVLVRDDAP